MKPRTIVPFDVFSMQVDVPVSTLVRVDGFGWTCGLCPLDDQSNVLFPDDLIAQITAVSDIIEQVLQRGGFENGTIGKLHVYFVGLAPEDGDAALAILKSRFKHSPIIIPIPVPHFYYDGMMVEIDVFTGPSSSKREVISCDGLKLSIRDSADLTQVYVAASSTENAPLVDRMDEISKALAAESLHPAQLLSDHWFLAGETEDMATLNQYSTHHDATVLVDAGSRDTMTGSLVFSRGPVEHTCYKSNAVTLHSKRAGDRVWIIATQSDAGGDLVSQTSAIMKAIAQTLDENAMSFRNVVKLTAHYVGGASPDELHGNMKIRHGYYGKPGPASTGLPVSALLGSGCKISIDVIAVS